MKQHCLEVDEGCANLKSLGTVNGDSTFKYTERCADSRKVELASRVRISASSVTFTSETNALEKT